MEINLDKMFMDVRIIMDVSMINTKIDKEWFNSIKFESVHNEGDNVIIVLKIQEAQYLMDVIVNGYDFIKQMTTDKVKFFVNHV